MRLRDDYEFNEDDVSEKEEVKMIFQPNTVLALTGFRGYKFDVVVCHNGNIYIYSVKKPLLDKTIEKYKQAPYNLGIEEAHFKAYKDFERFGLTCVKY